MSDIWIEILPESDQSDMPTPGSSAYKWQAMFACQVGVMRHQDWANLKWGFNAGALFDEAIERQKLFLESQHSLDDEMRVEDSRIRAIAFRYMNTSEGLLIALIGKVSAKTREEAELYANEFCSEILSTFPYDYSLSPAKSRDEFYRMTGSKLLLRNGQIDVVQIKRCESLPSSLMKEFPYFQGLWQSGGRSHEQIWRSVSLAKDQLLVNIMLRPTILYEKEIQVYSNLSSEISKYHPADSEQKVFNAYREWYEGFIKRRLTPWKKFYYLQIHIVASNIISESLIRSIGTVLTQSSPTLTQPGYQVMRPSSKKEKEWGERIFMMYLTSWGGQIPNPRLSDVADLDEVFSAVRFPYSPPGDEIKYFSLKEP